MGLVPAGCLLLFVIVVAAILGPNVMRARSRSYVTACKSNLKNISTAVKMYATDNGARCPDVLARVTPGYLRTIPTCTSTGRDTYSRSYTCVHSMKHETYTIVCEGLNHTSVGDGPNYPRYSSEEGLLEH